MRQTKLNLSEEDCAVIEAIRSKGLHRASEVNRAHVLASLDWRIGIREMVQSEIDAWQQARNTERRTIEWNFI